MPALNVDFTPEELAALRRAAARSGKALKAYVHDASLRDSDRQEFVTGAAAFMDAHAAEFADAFPDDAPDAARGGAAA